MQDIWEGTVHPDIFLLFFSKKAFLPDDMLSFPVIEFFCRDLFGFLNALIQRAVSSLLLLISDHITESLPTTVTHFLARVTAV